MCWRVRGKKYDEVECRRQGNESIRTMKLDYQSFTVRMKPLALADARRVTSRSVTFDPEDLLASGKRVFQARQECLCFRVADTETIWTRCWTAPFPLRNVSFLLKRRIDNRLLNILLIALKI